MIVLGDLFDLTEEEFVAASDSLGNLSRALSQKYPGCSAVLVLDDGSFYHRHVGEKVRGVTDKQVEKWMETIPIKPGTTYEEFPSGTKCCSRGHLTYKGVATE